MLNTSVNYKTKNKTPEAKKCYWVTQSLRDISAYKESHSTLNINEKEVFNYYKIYVPR